MVNRKRNYTLHFYLMAVMVAIALGCVNYLGMEYRTRLDLTADKRFTLSEGTESLFQKLSGTVSVTYYVDEEPPSKRINLERDVRDKLQELARSSNGKLDFRIERIGNEEAATRAEELEEIGVEQTVDIQKRGTDERAEMRGIQGYFSSIVIRYGTGDPKVINGIVNLVDRDDETREHRVDTLEFDIAYSILQMRNTTERPSFARLLKMIDEPVRIALFKTKEIPAPHGVVAQRVDDALTEMANDNPGQVALKRVMLDANPRQMLRMGQQGIFIGTAHPFDRERGDIALQPFANSDETQNIPLQGGQALAIPREMYFSFVYIELPRESGDLSNAIPDFTEDNNKALVKSRVQDMVWELFRPRTRIGFVLPPSDPEMAARQQPGEMPRNGHTDLYHYVERGLGYDTEWVDIKGKKRIPADLALLVVLEPNVLTERELYEIDRYLASGGNVVMLVQAWSAKLDFMTPGRSDVPLSKVAMEPHFEEWAKFHGLVFGEELLLRPNGKLQPYTRNLRTQQIDLVPARVRLAPLVEPHDLNGESVLVRGLASMPMPMVVEMTVDDDRLGDLEVERTDLIRFRNDVYRFFPENPASASIPTGLDLTSPSEVEQTPGAEKREGVLAYKADDEPLVAAVFRGGFPGYWNSEELKVPGWDGDPTEMDAPEVARPRPGSLMVVSSAGMLNTRYLQGYPQSDLFVGNPRTGDFSFGPVIETGVNFYRNVAEAHIYGDDMVNLRARSGVTPRIVGPVDNANKTFWFLACIAGMPFVLVLFAGARSYIRIREREEYETALGLRESK